MRNAATICLLMLTSEWSGGRHCLGLQSPARITLSTTSYPGAPRPPQDAPSSPYAMNYSDEVARNLGVTNGHMDLFSTRSDPSTPYVSGGVEQGRALCCGCSGGPNRVPASFTPHAFLVSVRPALDG